MGTDQANGAVVSTSASGPRTNTVVAFYGPRDESAPSSLSEEWFVALTVRYERRVRTFVTSLHPRSSDVDEIVQNAWMVAWKKLDTFQFNGEQPDEEFVRWLCTIARYEALKYRKKNAPRLLLNEDVIEKITALQFDEADYFETRHQALMECVEHLRARDRELIRRRYEENTSARDLADWIGRSVDAVYKSLNRIRTTLLACVDRALKREGYF
jgi:RNA polymerase sigma-70 factor, ECF subfamily